jgi:hypothetical protein
MSIFLSAIKFNHNSNSANHDALNLRKNATQFVAVPEWRRGTSVNPEDSLAAYSIEDTFGRRVTIQANFFTDDLQNRTVLVRAVQGQSPDQTVVFLRSFLNSPWAAQAAFYLVLYEEFLKASRPSTNVLGDLRPTAVTFGPTGVSDFVSVDCENHQLWTRGVGVNTVTWRWQYSLAGSPWIDFDASRHRIYTVLRMPRGSWQQFPYDVRNTQLPWSDVLDYSCRWAQTAVNLDDAATGVTAAVNALGSGLVRYDCPGGGGTHYTELTPFPVFNCTGFLNLLNGGIEPHWVNCIDCATVVSTFANILGCELFQSGMFSDFGVIFETNEILAIGSNFWDTPCGWPGFFYHEVAWKGECTAQDAVFDACLMVNGNFNPLGLPQIPLLPANIRFGNTGDGLYKDRLASPAGRPNCEPQPLSTRIQRPVI